jgi:hypothetical protein
MQPSPKDASTGVPQITASAGKPEKPAVKSEKKLAQATTKPTPVKSASAGTASGKAATLNQTKPLKVAPPTLRTADQGE